jgi:hypothetical protein
VLEDTIVRCLAFRREDRIATALEVIRNVAASVENGEGKMGFFAPKLIEDVALSPTAPTISESGVAATKWSQAAHSAIRRSRRQALTMFFVGATVGSVVVGSLTALAMRGADESDSTAVAIAIEDHSKDRSTSSVTARDPVAPRAPAVGTLAHSQVPAPELAATQRAPSTTEPAIRDEPAISKPAPELVAAQRVSITTEPAAAKAPTPTKPSAIEPVPSKPAAPTRPTPAHPATNTSTRPTEATTRAAAARSSSEATSASTEVWLSVRVKGIAEVSIDGDTPGTAPRRKRVRVGVHHVVMTGYPDDSEQQQRKEFDVNVTAGKEETIIYGTW